MYKLTQIFIIIFISHHAHTWDVDKTELILTFMVNRHGDRTPWEKNLKYSNDPTALAGLIKPYGYGDLTEAGKNRSYQLGCFIRGRYNNTLSPRYDPSEIYVRSTYASRTILTALYALAAMYYLPEEQWMTTMDWIPIPYTTVQPKYDFNLPFINCPTFVNASDTLSQSTNSEMDQFSCLFDELSSEIGYDLNETPLLVYSVLDLLLSQKSLGLALSSKVEELLPEIEDAATKAMEIKWGDNNYTALEAGVLLNEFLTMGSRAIDGCNMPKVVLYSAHDFNIYALMVASQLAFTPSPPEFDALFALELRKEMSTGKYYVMPMYVSTPGAPEVYPEIQGCGTPCEFSRFQQIVSKYARDINTWRTECGWNDDLDVAECGYE